MRDFGFCIYKALVVAPEKPKEEKEDKVSLLNPTEHNTFVRLKSFQILLAL